MDPAQLQNILLGVVGFCVVYILNGIKAEIRGVKADVHLLGTNLRSDIHDIYSRVGVHDAIIAEIRTRCDILHEQSKDRG